MVFSPSTDTILSNQKCFENSYDIGLRNESFDIRLHFFR